ncbi:hypothetical protein GHK92_02820 [Nocardioides sp. dk4132]|uniref:asparagine synthase-related protein n=1 Tax=unclassified Nocardioides TaxID=2615069 RepID=UPI001297BAFC|nr:MULTISPECIES: asparagine synthase-related protein [unclassified Nocardioides]MQW74795.1 hypothetical protein [Nocardioides sp. dk4132]QGA06687.1 hypothetical protein GFH29_04255 [Nocardioides sp. dk884]
MGAVAEPDPGLVVVSWAGRDGDGLLDSVQRALAHTDPAAVPVRHGSSAVVATWGVAPPGICADRALALTLEVRHHDRPVGAQEVRRALVERDTAMLAGMLPPFAAVALGADAAVLACVEALGLRHLYLRRGPDWVAISTSARLLAALDPVCALDLTAVAVQSQLGWQLGHRTLAAGVEQVAAGSLLCLQDGRVTTMSFAVPDPLVVAELEATVLRTRDLLRDYLDAYLRDHPDPVLQLSGGQDSRLLLSAIDPARRRGLRVMTVGSPEDADVVIASDLARRYGMRHEVLDLAGLEHLDPEEAWERCVVAARRLELGADPVARAALDTAEERSQPGPRLSGLGGEVARGFYYLGSRGQRQVTERRSRRLAAWRLLTNEAAADDALEPGFAAWARDVALTEVHRALVASGDPWFAATDRFYLEHRVQRWGGVTETAVCSRVAVANPMLDERFLAAVHTLAPADKRRSRFLARLQVALDPELASMPLDGRPAPASYAEPGPSAALQRARSRSAAARRKALQRVRGERRAPVGGPVLARQATAHLRGRPEVLEPLVATGVFREQWLDEVVSGGVDPDPATAALLVNLTVATSRQPRVPASSPQPEG